MRSASAASAVEWLSAEEEPDPIALKIAAKVAADQGGASRRARKPDRARKRDSRNDPARARCRAGNAARGIGREGFRAFRNRAS